MATNQVRIGAPKKDSKTTGGLLSAPEGSPLPTDAKTELDEAFVGLGLVGDGGLSENVERSTEDIRDWDKTIVRTVQSEHGLKFTFSLIERTAATLREVNGPGNVTEETDAEGNVTRTIVYNADELPVKVYVAEMRDRGGIRIRKVYPNAQITSISEVSYVKDAPITYECECTAYPDSSGNNQYEYELIPAAVAPAVVG